MGTSPQALLRGIVSRILPQPRQDIPDADVSIRLGRYTELYGLSLIRKAHLLADEGSYFLANNNAQTGILSSGATGFVNTTPALVVYNGDSPTNITNYKRLYLDFIKLVTTVVGSAASGLVNLQAAMVIDTGLRYVSGGTALVVVNPNMDLSTKPIGQAWFGAITASTPSASARFVDPLATIRPSVSATALDVVGETKQFNFGAVEAMLNGSITPANANNIPVAEPPVILGPNESFLLYLWQNLGATNVAATYAPNVGWFER